MVAGGNLPERIALFYPVYGIPFQIRNQKLPLRLRYPAGLPGSQKLPQRLTGGIAKYPVDGYRITCPCQRQLCILYQRSPVSLI